MMLGWKIATDTFGSPGIETVLSAFLELTSRLSGRHSPNDRQIFKHVEQEPEYSEQLISGPARETDKYNDVFIAYI